MEVAVIATIIALDRASASRNGIVDVPEHTMSGLLGTYVRNYYSLLWTSLPSFLFSLYSLAWAAFVSDSATRQPYVELVNGGEARRTIMLDYASLPEWESWYVAFRNCHAHLALGLLLNFLISVVLVPLASHLLVEEATQSTTAVAITFTTEFSTASINSTTNLQPFIDISTAIRAYNSSPPTWMTDGYAFERFSLSSNVGAGNLTANVSAYSALLECDTINATQYNIVADSEDDLETLTLSFTDRGCQVEQAFVVSSKTPIYAKAWYTFCATSNVNRFGMIAGLYSASAKNNITDFSVTSCIPTYWQTNGSLTMAYANTVTPSFISFTGESVTQISPGLQVVFENTLRNYVIFDPTSATNADAVGYSIYSAAQQQSSQTSPSASSILQSTQNVYATIYAALAKNVLLQPATSPTDGTVIFTTAANRLFIARATAYIIVAAMAVLLLCHVALFVYAKKQGTMLDEEPLGLLGKAKLLRRGDLFGIVDAFEERHCDIGEMQEYMKKHYRLGHGDRCWWDNNERRIKVAGIKED